MESKEVKSLTVQGELLQDEEILAGVKLALERVGLGVGETVELVTYIGAGDLKPFADEHGYSRGTATAAINAILNDKHKLSPASRIRKILGDDQEAESQLVALNDLAELRKADDLEKIKGIGPHAKALLQDYIDENFQVKRVV